MGVRILLPLVRTHPCQFRAAAGAWICQQNQLISGAGERLQTGTRQYFPGNSVAPHTRSKSGTYVTAGETDWGSAWFWQSACDGVGSLSCEGARGMLVRYGILFLGALFGGPALGADLNTPLNDKPTVGTEINRGAAAAFQCNLRYVVDLLRFSECVSDAASADEQRHPDYSSFQLGLYWQECVVLSIHIEPDKHGRTDLSASDLRFAKTTLALSYDQFRTRQKRIGLTDEQLVTAYAAGDPAWRPLVQQLHDWEKNPPKQP